MGVLILVEGQYYVGDVVNVGGVEGTVEEIGFRRTILRDASGTVHSVSNGEIRVSANFTRIYASAVVDIQGIRDEDVERAIDVMHQCGLDLAADPAWSDRLLGPPNQPIAFAFTDLGATIRMSCRVVPGAPLASGRRNCASASSMAFTTAGIQPNRRTGAAARRRAPSASSGRAAGGARSSRRSHSPTPSAPSAGTDVQATIRNRITPDHELDIGERVLDDARAQAIGHRGGALGDAGERVRVRGQGVAIAAQAVGDGREARVEAFDRVGDPADGLGRRTERGQAQDVHGAQHALEGLEVRPDALDRVGRRR